MKVYIAAPWANKVRAREVREELQALGHVVTSSWLDESDEGTGLPADPEVCRKLAQSDLRDIAKANTILVLTDPAPIGAGHHVEMGWALANDLVVVVAGPIKSIFHHLANQVYPNWEAARAWFSQ